MTEQQNRDGLALALHEWPNHNNQLEPEFCGLCRRSIDTADTVLASKWLTERDARIWDEGALAATDITAFGAIEPGSNPYRENRAGR